MARVLDKYHFSSLLNKCSSMAFSANNFSCQACTEERFWKPLFTNLTFPGVFFRFFFEPIKVFFRTFSDLGCMLNPYLIFAPLFSFLIALMVLTTHSSKFSGIPAGPEWITSVIRTIPPIRFRNAIGSGIWDSSISTTKPSITSSVMEFGRIERISVLAKPFA